VAIQPSPPFTLAPHDWKSLGIGLIFAAIAGMLGFVTSTVIPTLQGHEANDLGMLIVTAITAIVPVLLNLLRKWTTDTTTIVSLLGLVVLTLCCSCSEAAPPPPAAPLKGPIQTPPITVSVASDVQAVNIVVYDTDWRLLSAQRVVLNPTPTPPGPPVPPQPPVPPPSPIVLTERGKNMKAAADGVLGDLDRAGTAKALAGLYREIAKSVAANEITDLATLQATTLEAGNRLLRSRRVEDQWQPVRGTLSGYWTSMLTPKAQPIGEFGKLLAETADGLDVSGGNSQRSVDLATLVTVINLVQEVISLLKKT
jgi:hypothetical protein